MFQEVLKIIIVGSIPIFISLLILKKLFKITEIPIFLLIIVSMLITSLYEIYSIEKKLTKNRSFKYFYLKK